MESHLIIGLGRIGEKVLCEMRKRVYEVFADNRQTDVLLDYLSVTFDNSELNESEWNCWGEDIRLYRSQRMKAHHAYIPDEFLALIGQRVRELKSYYGEDNKITIHLFMDIEWLKDSDFLKLLYESIWSLVERVMSYSYISDLEKSHIYLRNINDLTHEFKEIQVYMFTSQVCLFSNRDEKGNPLNEDVVSIEIAELLFQYIYERSYRLEWQKSTVDKVGIILKRQKTETGKNIHTCNFMTLGLKRLVYPNNKIKWYAEKKVLYAQYLGLIYNQWELGKGYVKSCVDDGYIKSLIRDEINYTHVLDKLYLSMDYLTLQCPIPNYHYEYEKLDTYDSYWEKCCDFFFHDIIESGVPSEKWILSFDERMNDIYNHCFRTKGVADYFKSQIHDVYRRAEHIRKHIEHTLLNEWVLGKRIAEIPMSFHSIMLYIEVLKDYINSNIYRCCEIRENLSKKRTEEQVDVHKIKDEYDSLGLLRRLVSGKNKFAQYVYSMSLYYTLSTQIAALDFSISLQKEIGNQLAYLYWNICESINHYKCLFDDIEKKIECFEKSINLVDENRIQVVEEYCEWYEIRSKIEKDILYNEDLQKNIQNGFFSEIREKVNQTHDVSLHRDLDQMLDEVVSFCGVPNIILQDELRKIGLIDKNVIEKIQSQCETDEQIRLYVSRLIEEAKCPLYIEDDTPLCLSQISIPQYDDPSHYRERLIRVLKEMFGHSISIDDTNSCNEIIVTKIKLYNSLEYWQYEIHQYFRSVVFKMAAVAVKIHTTKGIVQQKHNLEGNFFNVVKVDDEEFIVGNNAEETMDILMNSSYTYSKVCELIDVSVFYGNELCEHYKLMSKFQI